MTATRFASLALLGFLLSAPFAAVPSQAASAKNVSDTVTLSLSAEGWVEAAKARVRVAVDSAKPSDEAGTLRAGIKETLGKLVPGADWHIITFNRSRDQAGLERWHLEAEARVPETALDGIYDRAKAQSRPGEQVSVAFVDFTPELAEREKVMADLRKRIYDAAKDELARLASVYPDRAFRLHSVEFRPQGPMPMPMVKTARGAGAMVEAAAPAPIGVAEHVEISATVVLAAAPAKPQDGKDD